LTEERRLETTAAELVMLEVAGHMLFLEQPEAFRAAVESFLSG